MAGGFTGSVEQFTTAHQQVSDTKNDMDAQLASLRSQIEATQGAWKGDAAGAFINVMERFDEKTRALNNALQDIADLLQQAGSTYSAAEQEQHHTIGKLGNVLG